jgi:hypothetical protein
MDGVPYDQIDDIENTPIFPHRGKIPSVKEPWPLNLQTVFSIIQSDHSTTLLSIHVITDLEMHPIYNV